MACESIDLDEVPLSDIADMISGFDCETITDFRLFNTGAFDDTSWQQALGELLLRLRVEKDDYQWIQCPNFKSGLDLMFVQIEEGEAYRYVAEYHQYLWVPSKYRRNSDGMKPADRKGLVGSEDFALFCWDSVNHLPAIRRISLKASLTSRLIDFKYLREAEAPAYTHGVSNDILDYEFDDDDDDIPAFSFPEA